jgi:hypothetical protein
MHIDVNDFNKSDDELFFKLATELISSGEFRLSGPISRQGKIQRAKLWFEGLQENIKQSICFDRRVIAYLADENVQNIVDIAAVVGDILSSSLSVPVGTVTVLLVKGRLKSLCQ